MSEKDPDSLLLASMALAVGGWLAIGRDRQEHRPLAQRKQRVMGEIAMAVVCRFEPVQSAVDRLTGAPNFGALVSLAAAPTAMADLMRLYDELTGAATRRRRWRQLGAPMALALLVACWLRGVPHDRRLPWRLGGVPLEDGNRWRDGIVVLSLAPISLQSIEGIVASQRIVLHLYATGRNRSLCLRSLSYTLAMSCLCALTILVSLRPATRLASRRDVPDPSPVATQGLLAATMAWMILGVVAPSWRLGQAGGPMSNRREQVAERLLRGLLVLSCYEGVRKLAAALQDPVPARAALMQPAQARLGVVYRMGDMEFLMQLFKTMINDARLVLVGYVDASRLRAPESDAPARAAEALRLAMAAYRRGQPASSHDHASNPLRDTATFNDDRFLAAVWRAYRRGARATRRRIPVPGLVKHHLNQL